MDTKSYTTQKSSDLMQAPLTGLPTTMQQPASAVAASTLSAYKASEKRFKPLTDAQIRADTALLDVRALSDDQQAQVARVGTWRWRDLRDGSERERPVLSFAGLGAAHQGFYVIPDAVDAAMQLQIAHACLTEYVESPHVTNMHLKNEQVAEIWEKARASNPQDPAKAPGLSKLHWGAAGYHYDWTARKYYEEDYSPVPGLLATLGASCAEACGEKLKAEAVIVNFYKKNSTMGGHQDDVEYTMDHPVVSLSLGSHCVFLKGTTTKEDAPLEVLLRSGDLAVLSGSSRLSFHGVAKVLPTPFEISDEELGVLVEKCTERETKRVEEEKKKEWKEELRDVQSYLETHRININIRQVYAAPTSEDERVETQRTEAVAKRRKLESPNGNGT